MVVGLEGDKFFVQDFGLGLSPEFMNSSTEGYCTIGFSTKRDSEDQLGFYGFGRLASLAYTNQYWVNTVYRGTAYEYLIFLDGNTIKQTLLSETPTEDPTGTRVVVQMKSGWSEEQKWRDAIKQQCAYFENTLISGVDSDVRRVELIHENYTKKSNVIARYLSKTHVVLGSVYYPIPWEQFKEWRFLEELGLGIYVGLNEGLTPTPSRESFIINESSKELLQSKFISICESLYEECNKELNEIKSKPDIVKLKYRSDNVVGSISFKKYYDLCGVLSKPQVDFLDPVYADPTWIYRTIRDSFTYNNFKQLYCFNAGTPQQKVVYVEKITPLIKEYLGSNSYAYKKLTKLSRYYFKIDAEHIDPPKRESYKESQKEEIEKRLVEEFIQEFFVPFDSQGYEQWKIERKSNRKGLTKEPNKGVGYYRAHQFDNRQCTLDKGEIDLKDYHYVFKAKKETAQYYWTFLNKIPSMIITKDKGVDLDNLQPSPELKRICSIALKLKVTNIIGKFLAFPKAVQFLGTLNPQLVQYIEETKLLSYHHTEVPAHLIDSLVETGELLKCFDKDEVKLRYLEQHFSYLKGLPLLEFNTHYGPTDRQKEFIKRLYILERWAASKEKQVEEVDTNQLELELNY